MSANADFRINPLTGDYDGQIDDLSNAVYLRIVTPLGSYWADPSLGSKLYLLQREKALQPARVLAEQYVRLALQPLIDDQRVDRIDVALGEFEDASGTTRLPLRVSVYRGGLLAAQFDHPVKVMQA